MTASISLVFITATWIEHERRAIFWKRKRQRGMSLGMAYCNGTTCKFIIEMILAISLLHSFGPAPGLAKPATPLVASDICFASIAILGPPWHCFNVWNEVAFSFSSVSFFTSTCMPPAIVTTADSQYDHYLIARQNVADQTATGLTPTADQRTILIIIGVYIAAILILWNMPIAKIILSPFKVHIDQYLLHLLL